MSFTTYQTGIEQGATKLLFEWPPFVVPPVEDWSKARRAETRSLLNTPISTVWHVVQTEVLLVLIVPYIGQDQRSTLRTLMTSNAPVTVKPEAGVATVHTCAWAAEQTFESVFEGPSALPAGVSIADALRPYTARLQFLILSTP